MKNARHARGFRDLLVYRKAQEVAKRIFEISRKFPKEEVYSLTDQIRQGLKVHRGTNTRRPGENGVMKNILSAS